VPDRSGRAATASVAPGLAGRETRQRGEIRTSCTSVRALS